MEQHDAHVELASEQTLWQPAETDQMNVASVVSLRLSLTHDQQPLDFVLTLTLSL